MKILLVLMIFLALVLVIPAHATVIEFSTDKTSYKKGDQIIFSGKTDIAHANKMVSVKVTPPQGKSFLLMGGITDGNGLVEIKPVDTTQSKIISKLSVKGIYNASLIYDEDPKYQGKWTIFDYSPDGSQVSPSAAQVMSELGKSVSSPQVPQTPSTSTTPLQPSIPTTSSQTPPTPTKAESTPIPETPTTQCGSGTVFDQNTGSCILAPSCGTGTVFDDNTGTCIVAPASHAPTVQVPSEPEPRPAENVKPQTATGYKTTHIPGFPDPAKTPQYYINRYKTEPEYRAWFDRNFPNDTIFNIVGVKGPLKTHIPGFPDPTKDPQSFVDRYNKEPEYKAWFDRNFPNQSIYDIVGLDKPTAASSCGVGTHLENGVCILDKKGGSGQCAIATAAYGSELAPQVQLLREVRDNVLFGTNSGTAFMMGFNEFYYSFSPVIADWERQSPLFKETVKLTITPMLSTMSILNHANIHSEQQMLGYGIGVILLNIGMYFVAPTIIIVKIQQRLRKA